MKRIALALILCVAGLTGCDEALDGTTEGTASESAAAATAPGAEALNTSVTHEVVALDAQPAAQAEQVRLIDVTRAPQLIESGMVGIRIQRADTGAFMIRSVIDGMPAAAAGLEAGDRVIAIDQMDTDTMDQQTFIELVRGDVGADVTLTVVSDNAERDVVITRENYALTQSYCQTRRQLIRDRDFAGVGVSLRQDNEGGVYVGRVMDGLPAAAAGLEAGDRITSIDGLATEGAAVIDYVSALRGELGAPVQLEVIDSEGVMRSLVIERASMVLPEGGGCGR